MYSKSLIAVFAVLGASGAVSANEPASQCNTAPVQCCDSSTTSSDPAAVAIIKSLGINVGPADIPVGLGCSPITVVGAGSGAVCDASPLCCEDNSFHGLISLSCTPVNLSL
ncbi:fungal hydrophobin [Gloeopeniophorella convolvens]|nr:fungal hydrophobin [Gloeopeniophorella convolvens]